MSDDKPSRSRSAEDYGGSCSDRSQALDYRTQQCLVFCLVSALLLCAQAPVFAEPPDRDKNAIEKIIGLGGKVQRDKQGHATVVEFIFTGLSDDELGIVNEVNTLREIRINEKMVSSAGIQQLTKLSKVEKLYLDFTCVDYKGLAHLRGLKLLKVLGLNHTKVDDHAMKHLRSLTELESLALGNTRITAAGMAHITALTNLQTLHLNDNQLDDLSIAKVKAPEESPDAEFRIHASF